MTRVKKGNQQSYQILFREQQTIIKVSPAASSGADPTKQPTSGFGQPGGGRATAGGHVAERPVGQAAMAAGGRGGVGYLGIVEAAPTRSLGFPCSRPPSPVDAPLS